MCMCVSFIPFFFFTHLCLFLTFVFLYIYNFFCFFVFFWRTGGHSWPFRGGRGREALWHRQAGRDEQGRPQPSWRIHLQQKASSILNSKKQKTKKQSHQHGPARHVEVDTTVLFFQKHTQFDKNKINCLLFFPSCILQFNLIIYKLFFKRITRLFS